MSGKAVITVTTELMSSRTSLPGHSPEPGKTGSSRAMLILTLAALVGVATDLIRILATTRTSDTDSEN